MIILIILILRFWFVITRKLFHRILFINTSPVINGFKLHHYMYGIFIYLIGLMAENNNFEIVGIAMFVDEMYCLIKCGNSFTWKDYHSAKSYFWTIIICIVLLSFRLLYADSHLK